MKSIKSLSELKGYLLKMNESGDNYLRERERQLDLANEISSIKEEDGAKDKSEKSVSPDKSTLKSGKVSVDQIVDKLNTIRSGKSFKDDNIKKSLDQYINSLKMPEKVALFAFLKGIAQIVTGEIVGSKALEPADPGPSIKMQKATYKKTIKPKIITKSKPEKSEEDTTPPAPIKPKK